MALIRRAVSDIGPTVSNTRSDTAEAVQF